MLSAGRTEVFCGSDTQGLVVLSGELILTAHGATSSSPFITQSNEDGGAEHRPSRSITISEAVLAVIAGSDTTSTALSNAFWCLLSHPNCYKRLQEEVDCYYPSGVDALNPKHHPKMVYLDAVL